MSELVGGKEARTIYKTIERLSRNSLIELYLETGRTHQIRVHMAHIGHPLVGDVLYGKSSCLVERHFLHAFHLGFKHPISKEMLEFSTLLPPDLAGAVAALRQS